MTNFRHVTKCRGGSGGDLSSFLPVRCLMPKLVHLRVSKSWECHLYFAQGCHLNFALTTQCRIIRHYGKCGDNRVFNVGARDEMTRPWQGSNQAASSLPL